MLYVIQKTEYGSGNETWISNEWVFDDLELCKKYYEKLLRIYGESELDIVEKDDDYESLYYNKFFAKQKLKLAVENLVSEFHNNKILNRPDRRKYLGYSIVTNFEDHIFLKIQLVFKEGSDYDKIKNIAEELIHIFNYDPYEYMYCKDIKQENDEVIFIYYLRQRYLKNKSLTQYVKDSGMNIPFYYEEEEKIQRFHDLIINNCLQQISNLEFNLKSQIGKKIMQAIIDKIKALYTEDPEFLDDYDRGYYSAIETVLKLIRDNQGETETPFGKIVINYNNKIVDYYGVNLAIPAHHIAVAVDESGDVYSYEIIPTKIVDNKSFCMTPNNKLIGHIDNVIGNWKDSLKIYK